MTAAPVEGVGGVLDGNINYYSKINTGLSKEKNTIKTCK